MILGTPDSDGKFYYFDRTYQASFSMISAFTSSFDKNNIVLSILIVFFI